MRKLLDMSQAEEISRLLILAVEEAGYDPMVAIPGAIQMVVDLANGHDDLLDEAAAFLADGGIVLEDDEEDETDLEPDNDTYDPIG